MRQTQEGLRWRWGVLAALVLALFGLLPQLNLIRTRGRDWHGSFYTYHPDESPYAAYLNSLIQGRTRRNDPYTGLDDQPDAPLAESLFSIQFIPAYALALPARLFGLSASTIFILLAPLSAFAAALAIFWLVGMVTGESRVAATGALVVLCLGGLARGQFLVRMWGGLNTPYICFPFLRRYEPAFPFPFFFLMCALVWLALSVKNQRAAIFSAIGAGLTFALLVFSYFHLWTAAAAWLACLVLLWLLLRPEGYRRDLRNFFVMGAIAIASLAPYAYMLSHRSPLMDSQQALTLSHAPDLFRPPELLGLLVLLALVSCARRGIINWRERSIIFAASFALMPVVVFNQQVLTGRSLQPIHYEQFIANYVALLAVVLAASLIWREQAGVAWRKSTKQIALAVIVVLCLARGLMEIRFINRMLEFNVERDRGWPVLQRLADLARSTPDGVHDPSRVVVFVAPVQQVSGYKNIPDALPAVAPQPVLWALHMFVFSAIKPTELKERFYQDLYYSGIDPQQIENSDQLKNYFQHVIFGWERAMPGLTANWQPITAAEERAALIEYTSYISSFNRERAAHTMLAYIVAPANEDIDLTNIDRWYERDAGERIGDFMLYRVKLRH